MTVKTEYIKNKKGKYTLKLGLRICIETRVPFCPPYSHDFVAKTNYRYRLQHNAQMKKLYLM